MELEQGLDALLPVRPLTPTCDADLVGVFAPVVLEDQAIKGDHCHSHPDQEQPPAENQASEHDRGRPRGVGAAFRRHGTAGPRTGGLGDSTRSCAGAGLPGMVGWLSGQGDLLALASTALLVGASSSWIRASELRYRNPLVVPSMIVALR